MGEIDAFLSAVEAAQWIVQLGENWDEEGSPGYSPNTLERAASFLLDHARASVERFGHCFAPPEIVPADAGSIDLHWQQGPMHLLVNVPEPPDEKITFYGEDDVRGTISGQIGIGVTRLDVAAWLL